MTTKRWLGIGIHLLIALGLIVGFSYPHPAQAVGIQGLYISAETMEYTDRLATLVKEAKAAGINLFVVDLHRVSPRYEKNLQIIRANEIPFTVRLVIFPGGALPHQITLDTSWQKKLALVEIAHGLGAQEVQLDYIRYSHKQKPRDQNAYEVLGVIKAFRERAVNVGMPLQIAVFGITTFRPERGIGQNLPLFASSIEVLCPMLYPSHYEPFLPHSLQPYKTVFDSLAALKAQFNQKLPYRVLPYIETYNYRHPLSPEQRRRYIAAEIKATLDHRTEGFIAWSANNLYHHLFDVLTNQPVYFPWVVHQP